MISYLSKIEFYTLSIRAVLLIFIMGRRLWYDFEQQLGLRWAIALFHDCLRASALLLSRSFTIGLIKAAKFFIKIFPCAVYGLADLADVGDLAEEPRRTFSMMRCSIVTNSQYFGLSCRIKKYTYLFWISYIERPIGRKRALAII